MPSVAHMSSYHTHTTGRHMPWEPFKSPLTAHDIAEIAKLTAISANLTARKQLEEQQRLADLNKRTKAAKTWGKPTLANMRWNHFTAKWE